MALKITAECISCGACEFECPNEAISYGAGQYEIDPDKCTQCSEYSNAFKCKQVCPVGCIMVGDDNTSDSKATIAEGKV